MSLDSQTNNQNNPELVMCDICFEEVTKSQLYCLPCVCKIDMCWDCIHRDYKSLVSKGSKCPLCRCSTRYAYRHTIIDNNYRQLKKYPIKGITYQYPIDIKKLDDDILKEIEDTIISINYIYNITKYDKQIKTKKKDLPKWGSER